MSSGSNPFCNCLLFTSNALARAMTKLADEEFGQFGFTYSYAYLLMLVNREDGIQPGEISRIMMLTPSTVTRLIEKLESGGFLERRADGRSVFVHSTARSKKLDAQLRTAWKKVYSRYSALIGEKEGKHLAALIMDTVVRLEK